MRTSLLLVYVAGLGWAGEPDGGVRFERLVPTSEGPHYWLRRSEGGLSSRSMSGFPGPDGGAPTTTESGSTSCEPVPVLATANPQELRSSTTHGAPGYDIVFTVRRKVDAWQVVRFVLTDVRSTYAVVGGCSATLAAGRLFADRAGCDAERSAFAYECRGSSCAYTDASAPVFDLGDCEKGLREATHTLRTIADAEESQRLDSLCRTLALFQKGGAWFERTGSGECRTWVARPPGRG